MSGCSRLLICVRNTTNQDVSPYALGVTSVSNIDEAAGIQNSHCCCDADFGGRCCGVRAAWALAGRAIDRASAHWEDSPAAAYPANRLAYRDARGPIADCHSPRSGSDDTPRTG